jgi:hypothetical protein
MMRAYREFVDDLPDPDMVGQTEYRIVHEALADDVSNREYDGDPDFSPAWVTEFMDGVIAQCETVKQRAREFGRVTGR